LILGHILFSEDCIGGTLRNANSAINTVFRVDYQKIGTFLETIHRTNVHAVGVFALNTVFGNDVSHDDRSVL
jgi:hypothetical protein